MQTWRNNQLKKTIAEQQANLQRLQKRVLIQTQKKISREKRKFTYGFKGELLFLEQKPPKVNFIKKIDFSVQESDNFKMGLDLPLQKQLER